MTKTQALRELKGLFNNTRMVGNIKVAVVGWHDNKFKVIDEGVEFDTITKTVDTGKRNYFGTPIMEFSYKPIAEFYYQSELADYIVAHSKM